MKVTQTTTFSDGQVVDPSVDLEAWVSGIHVSDLPVGAFRGSTLQFVVSASDAPATDERHDGMLWFKRGEGRLYRWDGPGIGSDYYTAVRDWICLSDRRELWVLPTATALKGCGMSPTYDTHPTHIGDDMILTNSNETLSWGEMAFRPIWGMWPWAGECCATLPYACGFFMIARDTGTTEAPFIAIEHGFCDVYMESGHTSAGGWMTHIAPDSGVTVVDGITAQLTECSDPSGVMVVGIMCDSGVTNSRGERLRAGFLFQWPPLVPNFRT